VCEASALGSGARFNMMQAALFNSMAASARVFDDTYLSTVVHPTSQVAAAARRFTTNSSSIASAAATGQ
jgi:2-methylcitrate dehydratase PrpD